MRAQTRHLLDVNVLLALIDEAHILCAIAQNPIAKPSLSIVTSALTENRVLRVLNLSGHSKYGPAGFEAVREQLARLCDDFEHEFWPCDITLQDDSSVYCSRVMGRNQITDAYLLALAVKQDSN